MKLQLTSSLLFISIFALNQSIEAQQSYGWDAAWGEAQLSDRPTDPVESSDITAPETGLANADVGGVNPYLDNGTTSVILTGGGDGNSASVYGGNYTPGATVPGSLLIIDSWIKQTGGDFNIIAGGNKVSNVDSVVAWGLAGDTHLMLDIESAGSVNYMVGGNVGESSTGTSMSGNSYISVFSNSLAGSVIGASAVTNGRDTSFVGNTHIYIYTALDQTGVSLSSNAIVGSNAYISGTSSSVNNVLSHVGDSNISIDLSGDAGGATSFGKDIVGSMYVGGGYRKVEHEGDSNIEIVGREGVSFDGLIVGGSYLTQGYFASLDASIENTNVTISGDSSFSSEVIGGHYHSSGTVSITGTSSLTISGGSFAKTVVAGNMVFGGTPSADVAATCLSVTGGDFAGFLVGGSVYEVNRDSRTRLTLGDSLVSISGAAGSFAQVVAGNVLGGGISTVTGTSRLEISAGRFTSFVTSGSATHNTAGTTLSLIANALELSISGGVFEGDVVGAAVILGGTATTTTQSVDIDIIGGTLGAKLIGGFSTDSGTRGLAGSVGSIDLTLDGGSVTDIYGGSWITRQTSATITQGAINLELLSGTITGSNVAAAGYQGSEVIMVTESTRVEIGSALQANGVQISGDYLFASGQVGSSVTGDRTLVFNSTSSYANVAGMKFVDFDVVEVGAGAEVDFALSATHLSDLDEQVRKTGEGTLALAADNGFSKLSVEAGSLRLAAGSSADTLRSVSIASGARLDMTAADTGIGSSLSLQNGSHLMLTTGQSGAAFLSGGSLTLDPSAKFNLSLSSGLGALFRQVIFTGLEAEDIEGFGLTSQAGFDGSLGVLASSVIAQLLEDGQSRAIGADYYILFEDGDLLLTNITAGNELELAVQGASLTALSAAQSDDMARQLRTLRNRTERLGLDPNYKHAGLPYYSFWITAEAGRSELDADGAETGYSMNSWGGSLGMDVDISSSLSLGVAMTAMYGDVDGANFDSGDGELDTLYLSAYARAHIGRWSHGFVLSFGMSDARLERRVDGLQLKGDTDGYSMGLLYEVGYIIPLNEDKSSCLQPIFSMSLIHSDLSAYTESGGRYEVHVDDEDMLYASFGLGARYESVVGTSVYNRSSVLSLRALCVVDAGSRRAASEVSLLGTDEAVRVQGAEAGAVGAQLGFGISIPLRRDVAELFLNVDADLRSGMSSGNASLGYRFAF